MRTCSRCSTEQPLENFSKKLKGFQHHCKMCVKETNKEHYQENRESKLEYQKAHYQNNSEAIKEYTKDWRKQNTEYTKHFDRLRKYGLTSEQFCGMLEDQNFKCAICEDTLKQDRSTHVDHDHLTGVVRGILCHHCNTGLGCFKDTTLRMKKAIQYLERNQESK